VTIADLFASAQPAWVRLSELFGKIERDLGISTDEAVKVLRPALESFEIRTSLTYWDNRLPGEEVRTVDWACFRDGQTYCVSEEGWPHIHWEDGTLNGWPVRILWDDVRRILTERQVHGAATTTAMGRARIGGGGAPQRHDWHAFWIEVALFASRNDLFEVPRTELQRHMEDWAAKHMDPVPDSATIRAMIKRLYDAVEGERGRV
jgi:hypothetical protein